MAETVRLTTLSHGAGWACKISPGDLAQVLSQLPQFDDPNVLVGTGTSDDAAVYRLGADMAIVQTVDYFTPIVDDPYGFGAISAANALSDIYAMGGRPLFALNIVGFPTKTLPMAVLKDILRGGADKVREAGAAIIGGHSIDDAEPKYGLVVTGLIHPDRVMTNAAARVGDDLILTKPLGMGIISTAVKNEKAAPDTIRRAIEIMATLNRGAAEAMEAVGAHACTDITGFGLLGHLREMTAGSHVGARVRFSAVPVLPEIRDLIAQGQVPGGTQRNHRYLNEVQAVDWGGMGEPQQMILSDAQTSGGLLIAVPKEKSGRLVEELTRRGTPAAAKIGEIVDDPTGRILIEA